MVETAIRANTPEAEKLFQRGVAAARGGQKRIAAGLLTRSVQLDPHNETAWLWLGGVLDDPHQMAFCLEAVLRINPANTHAKRGLQMLEERKVLQHGPKPPVVAQNTAALPTLDEIGQSESDQRAVENKRRREAQDQRDSWWVRWRHAKGDEGKSRLFLPLTLILLLGVVLLLHNSLLNAREANLQQIAAAEEAQRQARIAAAIVPTAVADEPAKVIFDKDTASVRDAEAIYYLSAITPLREQLRNAVDNYRSASGKPGATSVGLTATTRQVYQEVERALEAMQKLDPPSHLETAHNSYIAGLEAELLGWQAMLDFYGSYRVEFSNRAGMHFQEANSHFDRAKQLLAAQPERMEQMSKMSVHTPR